MAYQLWFLIVIPIIIGYIIGMFFKPTDAWREKVKRKELIPPPYVFSIVWSILYLILGFILYRVIHNEKLLAILIINLLFNYAFSPIQFGLMDLHFSILIVFFTWLTANYLAIELYKNQYHLEYYLIIPYILWLTFALALSILSVI